MFCMSKSCAGCNLFLNCRHLGSCSVTLYSFLYALYGRFFLSCLFLLASINFSIQFVNSCSLNCVGFTIICVYEPFRSAALLSDYVGKVMRLFEFSLFLSPFACSVHSMCCSHGENNLSLILLLLGSLLLSS